MRASRMTKCGRMWLNVAECAAPLQADGTMEGSGHLARSGRGGGGPHAHARRGGALQHLRRRQP
eukprot:6438459-Pyramimonas_sp.AAC.1